MEPTRWAPLVVLLEYLEEADSKGLTAGFGSSKVEMLRAAALEGGLTGLV